MCSLSSSANSIQPSKWDIYCIYGSVSWYMQQYMPSTSAFFRPRPAASDEKNPRSRGYIVAYSPRKHNIYITYIPLIFRTKNDFFFSKSPYNTELRNPQNPGLRAILVYIALKAGHMRAYIWHLRAYIWICGHIYGICGHIYNIYARRCHIYARI